MLKQLVFSSARMFSRVRASPGLLNAITADAACRRLASSSTPPMVSNLEDEKEEEEMKAVVG